MKNKRGDISITLLVIGVFAVCTLAIVTFLLHEEVNSGEFANLEIIEDLHSKAEDFYFYINSGLSSEEAAEKIGADIQNNRLILSTEQKKNSKVVISVQYIIELGD